MFSPSTIYALYFKTFTRVASRLFYDVQCARNTPAFPLCTFLVTGGHFVYIFPTHSLLIFCCFFHHYLLYGPLFSSCKSSPQTPVTRLKTAMLKMRNTRWFPISPLYNRKNLGYRQETQTSGQLNEKS